jgi:hydrogenase expression/formation protein HypE
LNEITIQSDVGIRINEAAIPVKEEVRAACEVLGLDPLYVANEGKLLMFVAPGDVPCVLEEMRKNRYGKEAQIIGEVIPSYRGRVIMATTMGGTRIVEMPLGEQLPRIC